MNTWGYLVTSIILLSIGMMMCGLVSNHIDLAITGFILFWVVFGTLIVIAIQGDNVVKDLTSKSPITSRGVGK